MEHRKWNYDKYFGGAEEQPRPNWHGIKLILILPTRHKVMKMYVIVPFTVLNPPGTPIIDYSRLIDHMASKSRLKKYGRDHDR